MPNRPKTPCRQPGCPALVDKPGYCPKHKRAEYKRCDAGRPSAAKRGYSRNWRCLRLMVLRRQPICATEGCDRPAEHVDHIVPLWRGGTNELSNLRGLCRFCHARKTAAADGGFGNQRKGEGE